jgi:hypothetical protein
LLRSIRPGRSSKQTRFTNMSIRADQLTTRTALEPRCLRFLRSALGPAADLQNQRSNDSVLIHPVPHIRRHPQILNGPQIVVRHVRAVHGGVLFAVSYNPIVRMSDNEEYGRNLLGRARRAIILARIPGFLRAAMRRS